MDVKQRMNEIEAELGRIEIGISKLQFAQTDNEKAIGELEDKKYKLLDEQRYLDLAEEALRDPAESLRYAVLRTTNEFRSFLKSTGLDSERNLAVNVWLVRKAENGYAVIYASKDNLIESGEPIEMEIGWDMVCRMMAANKVRYPY